MEHMSRIWNLIDRAVRQLAIKSSALMGECRDLVTGASDKSDRDEQLRVPRSKPAGSNWHLYRVKGHRTKLARSGGHRYRISF